MGGREVKIECHCGKKKTDSLWGGEGGLWNCTCGCSYKYQHIEGLIDVNKVGECPFSRSRNLNK